MKTPSFAHEIGESALAGVGRNNMWISSIWNGFGKAWKHQVLHTKLENLHWQGWAGIIYVNIFYLKWLWEGMKTPSFAHEIGESALAGVGRNNVCEYLLFEMALERHENTKCCTQNWGIMYVNIFYLKWLWEGMKTQSFAHKIGESALAGVGRNNICEYLLFEMALGRLRTPSFAHEIGESALAGVGRNNICEYLLFEMALARH